MYEISFPSIKAWLYIQNIQKWPMSPVFRGFSIYKFPLHSLSFVMVSLFLFGSLRTFSPAVCLLSCNTCDPAERMRCLCLSCTWSSSPPFLLLYITLQCSSCSTLHFKELSESTCRLTQIQDSLKRSFQAFLSASICFGLRVLWK